MFEYINVMVRISNLELLRMLQENSRVPFVKLARHLGVSETAVRKRVKKLEKDGVIRKFTVEIDPKKIGLETRALIGLDTKPEKYMTTIDRLKGMKDILCLYSSSGDHMICMECWFEDSKKLGNFLKSLKKIEGVTRICPAIMLEKIK
jgi:Lrp/AsnC family transcriptional regulator for asnA, asnC and gidA